MTSIIHGRKIHACTWIIFNYFCTKCSEYNAVNTLLYNAGGFFSYRTRPRKHGTVPASANTGSTCSTRANGTPSRWKAIFQGTWKTSKVSSSRASFPPQSTASRWVFPMDRKCPALSRKRNASSHYKQVNAIETRSSPWFNRSVSFCLILYRIDDFFHGNPNYS